MGFPIACNNQALVPAATTLIVGAGNYFMDTQSLSAITVTAIAAGRVAGVLYMSNAALTNIYMQIVVEGVAAGAGITAINAARFASNVVWKRGDSINLTYFNTVNTNACLAEFNFFGSNLP